MVKLNVQVIGKTFNHRASGGMIITDRNQLIVAVNDEIAELTGYAKEQLIGQSIHILLADERIAEKCELIWETVLESGYWQGEIDHYVENGQKRTKMLTVYALSGATDECYVWCFTDTETSASLSESEQMLRAIYQTAPLAVIPLCKNMTIKDWGHAAEALFGWKREEVIGQSLSSLFYEYPHHEVFSYPLKEKKAGECMVKRKDGTLIDVAYAVISVTDSDGNVTGYIVMFEDITRRRQKDIEHKRQVELAKKIQRSLLTPPIQNNVVTMDAVYIPSDDLSGDIYACYQIDRDRYGIIIIDVMGHGISSSLVSMLLRSLLRGLIVRVIDPVYVATELEKHVQNLFPDEVNEIRYLFSMIYLVIDTKRKQIEYTNAGHPAGLLVSEDGEIIELDKGGLAIGSPFSVPFEKEVIHYRKRTRLFLYTDGILDEIDSSILQSMNKIRTYTKMYSHLSDKQFLHMLMEEGKSSTSPVDDICLLSITVQ
ncbi:SpoIIE family protein phosphatase [Parageobacillus sp. VR-IP]|uniref:SpoIIE family protein phosphatase n=1 Tax=Parageobacillus sp. VR-IP TaxID=2742205 RepID=UPI00158240AB|nr:SpoIIE family protein phosphatase [Parageobacillus sp. VR-IP]NUK31385.1 SpoIIE family protein phosphatase [Parageobacillus sp. VR-IP]